MRLAPGMHQEAFVVFGSDGDENSGNLRQLWRLVKSWAVFSGSNLWFWHRLYLSRLFANSQIHSRSNNE